MTRPRDPRKHDSFGPYPSLQLWMEDAAAFTGPALVPALIKLRAARAKRKKKARR